MSDQPVASPAPMAWQVQLYEDDPNSGLAFRRLKWRIDQSVLEKLKGADPKADLYMVIMYRDAKDRVQSCLRLVTSNEVLVRLRSAGSCIFYARLALATRDDYDSLKKWTERQGAFYSGGTYTNPIEERLSATSFAIVREERMLVSSYAVMVDADNFAKPMAPTEARWVNAWFKHHGSPDECSLRGRRLFAYTLQVPLTLLWLCLGVMLAMWHSFFLLSRGIQWGELNPIDGSLSAVVGGTRGPGSVIREREDGSRRNMGSLLHMLSALIIPRTQLVVLGVAFGLYMLLESALAYKGISMAQFTNHAFWYIVGALNALLVLLVFITATLVWVGNTIESYVAARALASRRRQLRPIYAPQPQAPIVAEPRIPARLAGVGDYVAAPGNVSRGPGFFTNPVAWGRAGFNRAKVAVCRPFAE